MQKIRSMHFGKEQEMYLTFNFGTRSCLHKNCLGVTFIMDNETLTTGNTYLEVGGMSVFLNRRVNPHAGCTQLFLGSRSRGHWE